jgi:hypothetical protein
VDEQHQVAPPAGGDREIVDRAAGPAFPEDAELAPMALCGVLLEAAQAPQLAPMALGGVLLEAAQAQVVMELIFELAEAGSKRLVSDAVELSAVGPFELIVAPGFYDA